MSLLCVLYSKVRIPATLIASLVLVTYYTCTVESPHFTLLFRARVFGCLYTVCVALIAGRV